METSSHQVRTRLGSCLVKSDFVHIWISLSLRHMANKQTPGYPLVAFGPWNPHSLCICKSRDEDRTVRALYQTHSTCIICELTPLISNLWRKAWGWDAINLHAAFGGEIRTLGGYIRELLVSSICSMHGWCSVTGDPGDTQSVLPSFLGGLHSNRKSEEVFPVCF